MNSVGDWLVRAHGARRLTLTSEKQVRGQLRRRNSGSCLN